MTEPLCVLTVHAHPDDEASKGAGTIAKYQAEGVRTVLVCCTGGEEGDILNPAMDRPEIVDNLQQVRREELDRAAAITAGLHHHVAAGIDREVGIPPAVQAVEIGAAGDRPGLIGSALRHGKDCCFGLTIGTMGNAAVLANGVGRHGR